MNALMVWTVLLSPFVNMLGQQSGAQPPPADAAKVESAKADDAKQPPGQPGPSGVRPPVAPTIPEFNEQMWRQRNMNLIARYSTSVPTAFGLNEAQTKEFNARLAALSDKDVAYFKRIDPEKIAAQKEFMLIAQEASEARRNKAGPEKLKALDERRQQASKNFMKLNNDAPLTDQNVLQLASDLLPADKAAAGRQEFDRMKQQRRMQPPASPQNAANPQTPQVPAAPLPPQMARPSHLRDIDVVAPALLRWRAVVDERIRACQFDNDQTAKAQAILSNVLVRAEQAMKDHADELSKAEAEKDAAKRETLLLEAHRPVDLLYDELTRRIVGVSRMDQHVALKKASTLCAPPVSLWGLAVARIGATRRYDDDQLKSARAMLAEVTGKAAEQEKQAKPELDKAAVLSDSTQAGALIDHAMKPLDSMFQELVAKVEGLARPDQKSAAEQPAPAVPPVVMQQQPPQYPLKNAPPLERGRSDSGKLVP